MMNQEEKIKQLAWQARLLSFITILLSIGITLLSIEGYRLRGNLKNSNDLNKNKDVLLDIYRRDYHNDSLKIVRYESVIKNYVKIQTEIQQNKLKSSFKPKVNL